MENVEEELKVYAINGEFYIRVAQVVDILTSPQKSTLSREFRNKLARLLKAQSQYYINNLRRELLSIQEK